MYSKDVIPLIKKDHWFSGEYNNYSFAFHISDYLLCDPVHMHMNVTMCSEEVLPFLLMCVREWGGREIDNELLNK